VQKIVDIHHGKIGVESTEGEGTTFTVKLPAEDQPQNAQNAQKKLS
jgi:signal transduction histidine kinase